MIPTPSDHQNFSPKHRFLLENSGNDKPTPVLLVCIFNKNSTLITHDILYKAFSDYGDIHKAHLFPVNSLTLFLYVRF